MLRLSVLKPHSEMVVLSWLAGLFSRWNHICGSIELKRGQLIVVTGISTCSYRNSPGLKSTHKSLWLVTSYWHILIGSVIVELCCHTAPPPLTLAFWFVLWTVLAGPPSLASPILSLLLLISWAFLAGAAVRQTLPPHHHRTQGDEACDHQATWNVYACVGKYLIQDDESDF